MQSDALILIAFVAIVVGLALQRRAPKVAALLIAAGPLIGAWLATWALQVRGQTILELGNHWVLTSGVWAGAVTVTGWLAMALLWRGLQRRPLPHPVCRRCGYNLRERAVDRCPECGHGPDRRGPRLVARRWPWLVAATLTLVVTGVIVRAPHVNAWGWTAAVPDRVMVWGWPWLPERLVANWQGFDWPVGHGPDLTPEGTLYARMLHTELNDHARLAAELDRALARSPSIRRVARAWTLLSEQRMDTPSLDARQSASLVRALEADTSSREILWFARFISHDTSYGSMADHPLALHAETLRRVGRRSSETGASAFRLWLAIGEPLDDEAVARLTDLGAFGAVQRGILSELGRDDPRIADRLLALLAREIMVEGQRERNPGAFGTRVIGQFVRDGVYDQRQREQAIELMHQLLLTGDRNETAAGWVGLLAAGEHALLADTLVGMPISAGPFDQLRERMLREAMSHYRNLLGVPLRDAVVAQRYSLSETVHGSDDPARRAYAAALLVFGPSENAPERVAALDTLRKLAAAEVLAGTASRLLELLGESGAIDASP